MMSARELYRKILAMDPSGDQALNFLAAFSGVFHEIRHAHDIMSTVVGHEVLFSLLNCYQNIFEVLNALAQWFDEVPSRVVPLPIRGNESMLSGIDDGVLEFADYIGKKWDAILENQQPSKSSHSSRTKSHLLELLAINVQLGFVAELFGSEAEARLRGIVESSTNASLYLQTRDEVADIFLARGLQGPSLAATMNYLAWCGLTSTHRRGDRLNESLDPVVYFEALVDHVSRSADLYDFEKMRSSVDAFSSRWGLLTPHEMTEDYTELLQKRFRSRRTRWADSNRLLQGQVIGCWGALIQAYRYLSRIAVHRGELFFSSQAYGWGIVRGIFPSVLVHIREAGQDAVFESFGRKYISVDRWTLLNLCATMLRLLLLHGRGNSGDIFHEDLVFEELEVRGWAGTQFRFSDEGGIFQFPSP